MASVITLDMIKAFAANNQTDLTDGSQYPGVVGSLEVWEQGEGTWDETLSEEVFGALHAVFTHAVGLKVEAADLAASGKTDGVTSTE